MFNKTALLARKSFANFARFAHHSHGGIPGENLPFQFQNKYRLTLLFAVFCSTGIGAPFLIVRHQMLKK